MQYIKHYYVNDVTGDYLTTTNDAPAKRHPVKEIPGLGVKVWSHDPDGIDVCISEVADEITLTDIEVDGKYAVKVLTGDQYNSVINLQQEIETLATEIYPDRLNPSEISTEVDSKKVKTLEIKLQEYKDLINSL
jgi:hypothetical protein